MSIEERMTDEQIVKHLKHEAALTVNPVRLQVYGDAAIRITQLRTDLAAMTERAEKAEAERDAVLEEARVLRSRACSALDEVECMIDNWDVQQLHADARRIMREYSPDEVTRTEVRVEEVRDQATEIARLREALTPSGDTKAAYMGEFKFNGPEYMDENMQPRFDTHTVPWTTIKEIMAAIRDRAALNPKGATDD